MAGADLYARLQSIIKVRIQVVIKVMIYTGDSNRKASANLYSHSRIMFSPKYTLKNPANHLKNCRFYHFSQQIQRAS